MEILRNLTEAMLNSGNGPLGHFGDLFGAGLLGAVHSYMTSYYESTIGHGSPSVNHHSTSSSHSSSTPNLSDIFADEFELTPTEKTTLSDIISSSEQITLSDVIGS